MKTLSAKDAKYGFGRLIDLARAEPVAVAKHGRPVVVVMAVEEYERLKFLETGHVDSRPSTTGKAERWLKPSTTRSSPSSVASKPTSGRVSHLTPDSRTLSADAKKSESPRWR